VGSQDLVRTFGNVNGTVVQEEMDLLISVYYTIC
jgi:hypothetical protein